MAGLHLYDLPVENLQHIANYLHASHIPSLVSFALASKACHDVAKVWLFHNIQLEVNTTDPTQLQQEAGKWTETLQRTRSQHHVRQVHIVLQSSEWKLNNNGYSGWDEVYETGRYRSEDSVLLGDGEFKPVDQETDRAWLPVADLIGLLSHVTDLVYTLAHTLPPCLLRVLHEQHPQCRLHLHRFRFKSLHEATIDPHEMAIATSPCLYSVTVRHAYRMSDGRDDWNQEAHMRLVAGMAPNLKVVHSLTCRPASSAALYRRSRTPRQPWPGFPQYKNEPSPSSLDFLSLFGFMGKTCLSLTKWDGVTDFASLRSLELKMYKEDSGPVLAWAAGNLQLPKLKELRLQVYQPENSVDFASSHLEFFSMIPPLEALEYSGPHNEILSFILDRHGPRLRKLWLEQCLDLPAVREVQQKCPRLEDFKLKIKRSLSDDTELSVYGALGKMHRLTKIFLTLDCFENVISRQPEEPIDGHSQVLLRKEFDDPFDRTQWRGTIQNGHVREAFLRCAVDEALARSIWDTIEKSREGRPLQSLEIHTIGGENFGDGGVYRDLSGIISWVRRSYRLKRSVRDDEDGIIVVRELGREAREASEDKFGPKEPEDGPVPKSAFNIFRRIWPKKEESQDWHHDWSSLPLRR